ncbi:hypothetical protein SCHPADRAFT_409847 [Schizopora paradoxa]|uniref:Terpenoid synthase n=1 Tax=Schizopora paradoxa TaxID=27342 RepID=A0A0H2S707_9AGAM|nr:hypothetical protein SCHPADRAFT_409847 [Schizopora paradoxa]
MMFSSLLSRIAWNPYYATSPRRHSMTRLKLPTIITTLDGKFEMEVNEWCSAVTKDTTEWMESQIDFTRLRRKASHAGSASNGQTMEEERNGEALDSRVIPDIKPSLLAALAFPFADYTQLRVCADCLQWMFLLQWWAFEGSLLLEYEENSECHASDTSVRASSSQLDDLQSSNTRNIGEGISKLLDSVLTRIPINFVGQICSSLIAYCERLSLQSTRSPEISENETNGSKVITDALRQIETLMTLKNAIKPANPSAFPWSAPFCALLNYAYDFPERQEGRWFDEVKNVAVDILQWTHDMLSFTSALCSSSDPSRRVDHYPSFFTSNTLLEVCKSQRRRATLFSRFDLTSPSLDNLTIAELQQAVDSLGTQILQRIDQLQALRPDDTEKEEKKRYWRAVACLVAGVLHWSFQTEFYFRPSSADFREKGEKEISF